MTADTELGSDQEEVTVRQSPLWEMICHPFHTSQGMIEFFLAWVFTRRWVTVVAVAPVLLLFFGLGGLIAYGWSLDRNALMNRYASWSDEELNDEQQNLTELSTGASEKDDSLMKVEGVTQFGEVLLRRVLQLGNSDPRTRYLVALQIGNRGRRGQARLLMRQIAPERNSGFALAHWSAIDRSTQGPVPVGAETTVLVNDLEVAATWPGTGLRLREILAEYLERVPRIGDAIRILQTATEVDSRAWVQLVAVASRNGRKQVADDASKKAKLIFSERIVDQTAQVMDYINMARLLVLDENTDEAINQLYLGLKQFPEDRLLKLMLSECYRVKFILTYRETEDGVDCKIEYLDEALKADPTNLAVSEEVAKLLARGGNASPVLTEALDKQLADGQATTMTHLMLATRWLVASNFEAAIPHLEVALRKAPNAPIVLNNLALALSRTAAENVPRSRELIDRALRISGPNAEMLDSQGEIRMLAKDYVGAVESFESAIGLDANRIQSRKKLIEAYKEAGLMDLIAAQTEKIRQLETSSQAAPKNGTTLDSPSNNPPAR